MILLAKELVSITKKSNENKNKNETPVAFCDLDAKVIYQRTRDCFENVGNLPCVDFILTNVPIEIAKSFQTFELLQRRLPDIHKLIFNVFKTFFPKN